MFDLPPTVPGAAPLAFTACLHGLRRCTSGLRGFPGSVVPPDCKNPRLDPLSFASSSKTLLGSCGSSTQFTFPLPPYGVLVIAPCASKLLSCGFPKIASPLTFTACVRSGSSSLESENFLRPHVAKRETPSVLVVLPDFDGLLRISFAGLLRPAASHEVRAVSVEASLSPP